jgi:hypothetical protein
MNFFASWTWFIDETTTFGITAGPTFVDSSQDAPPTVIPDQQAVPFLEAGGVSGIPDGSIVVGNFGQCAPIEGQPAAPLGGICPTTKLLIQGESAAVDQDIANIRAQGQAQTYNLANPFELSDTSWTIFGEATLSKRWTPTLVSTLSYQRTDSTASGIAGSATVDFVNLVTTWQIGELWSASARADFTRRESVSPTTEVFVVQSNGVGQLLSDPGFALAVATNQLIQTVTNQDLDTNRWGAGAAVSRRITENLQASIRYTYNNQTSAGGTAGASSDFDDHLVSLGIVYAFDRYNLW